MTEQKATNITWHQSLITRADREERNRHKGAILWLTGLPSSGKSTLAHEIERQLFQRSCNSYVLDGDNVRHGLNKNLGFSPEDRKENIRRLGEVAKLFADAGVIVITAFISPYREDRDSARALNEPGTFFEIFCKCSAGECEKRDPKGLWQKARKGELKEFTGVSAPYEDPERPEIVVETDQHILEECALQIMRFLEDQNIIRRL
ncbi:MAG: adenylyl-sulfate kinase [Dehalococcoidia bacterium]|nr:adenylyl-sulfate kinase [Dehalococcoidia bacterium]